MSDYHSTQKITELALELGRAQVQIEMQNNRFQQMDEASNKMQEQIAQLNQDNQRLRANQKPAGTQPAPPPSR